MANNVNALYEPLSSGKFYSTLARSVGLVFAIIPVVSNTVKTYQETKSLKETLKTFVKQAGKSLIAWEIGTLAFVAGMALMPVAGPLAAIAGAISMGLASALTHKILGKILNTP